VLLFTTFATLLSAFTFFGGPNLAFAAGPEWLIVMGTLDGVLFAVLWYAIGYRQWLIGDRHGYVTLGEMLGDRFGSVGLRALVAGVSLLWLFPYVMLQQMGAGEALVGLTDGVVPYWGGAALVTAFMILYVVLAGMRGVARGPTRYKGCSCSRWSGSPPCGWSRRSAVSARPPAPCSTPGPSSGASAAASTRPGSSSPPRSPSRSA